MSRKSFTAEELSQITGAPLIGNARLQITGVNTLDEASNEDVSFLANSRYIEAMHKSHAALICCKKNEATDPNKSYLVADDPSALFQQLVELFLPKLKSWTAFASIHPTAQVHPGAIIGEGVTLSPYCVIDEGVEIGDGTFIGAHVYIGQKTLIGKNVTIHPSCVVREYCEIQDRVILQPGAIIGSCGFGYLMNEKFEHCKLEQLGSVLLEEDVEIGANTTIDRARFKKTIIRKGTKIDNLVQIAHNVEVGEHNIMAAQTGIAGSAKTGSHVMLGGQVGVLGHVTVTDRVLVATRGGVSKSIKKPGKYRGSPAIEVHEYNRQKVHVRKLESYLRRIEELERKVKELTQENTCI